jgi:glycosyltransferase involved in cell wall biosynthesis
VKEADALAADGHDVTVVGATVSAGLVPMDIELSERKPWCYENVLDAASRRFGDRTKWLGARIRRRIAREFGRAGFSSRAQLGYAGPQLLSYCVAHPSDLYIIHNPEPLWVGVELLGMGRRVAVDFEDWYSEDLLEDARRLVPLALLAQCEAEILRGAAYSSTTSSALSAALAAKYNCAPPAVVYNSFSLRDRESIDGESRDRKGRDEPSLTWFSQVIGPGRGLETLIDCLGAIQVPVEIHLRGKYEGEYAVSLLARAPEAWRPRIHFHSPVAHRSLVARIAEHDLAFAGDLSEIRSRDLTITNKILQYLLAGVPVVASDTAGNREVHAIAGEAVTLFGSGDPASLAPALNRLLSDRDKLRKLRARALSSAEEVFCWEKSAPVIQEKVRASIALSARPRSAAR